MPEASTGSGSSSPIDLGAMVGSVRDDAERATSNLANITSRKLDTDESIIRSTEGRMEADRGIAAKHLAAQGIEAEKLQPWNAEQEREKHYHDPIQTFGSLASVFAIAASAFTHAPMANALNASAAAMNAVKENDDKEYERAYTAWKGNMDLAKKRFDMQHGMYTDAIHLMDTDASVGRVKLQNAAVRFGDQQILALLDAGMYGPLIDTVGSRLKMAEGLFNVEKMKTAFEKENIRKQVFDKFEEENNPDHDPQKTLTNFNHSQGLDQPWQQQFMQNEVVRTQGMPNQKEEILKSAAQLRDATQRLSLNAVEAQSIKDETAELIQSGMNPTEAQNEALRRFIVRTTKETGGGNTLLTNDRRIQADLKKKREEWKAEGKSDDEITRLSNEFVAHSKADSTPITSNRRDDLASLITRSRVAENTIDDVERLLVQYKAMTGLGGKITRPFEIVGNWFGSDDTARKQFESYISELKLLGPRLLNEAKSRPLAAEEHQIAAIVPGLSMGDTTQHTAQELKKLQGLFRTLRADWTKRYKGTFDPDSALPSGRGIPRSTPLWQQAPLE